MSAMLLPHRHEPYTQLTSVNTGVKLWVPNSAVPMLTDSAHNARCIHGNPLVPYGDDSSILDIVAEMILHD